MGGKAAAACSSPQRQPSVWRRSSLFMLLQPSLEHRPHQRWAGQSSEPPAASSVQQEPTAQGASCDEPSTPCRVGARGHAQHSSSTKPGQTPCLDTQACLAEPVGPAGRGGAAPALQRAASCCGPDAAQRLGHGDAAHLAGRRKSGGSRGGQLCLFEGCGETRVACSPAELLLQAESSIDQWSQCRIPACPPLAPHWPHSRYLVPAPARQSRICVCW